MMKRFTPRGWFGRRGPTAFDGEDRGQLVYVGRHLMVTVFRRRSYRAWWVWGIAGTVRIGRVQVQWL